MLITELLRHQAKIVKYAKRPENDVMDDMYFLLRNIHLYDEAIIEQHHWLEAERLTNGVDHFDVSYVALALQTDGLLWTGDKKLTNHLKEMGFEQVIGTSDLYELLDIS